MQKRRTTLWVHFILDMRSLLFCIQLHTRESIKHPKVFPCSRKSHCKRKMEYLPISICGRFTRDISRQKTTSTLTWSPFWSLVYTAPIRISANSFHHEQLYKLANSALRNSSDSQSNDDMARHKSAFDHCRIAAFNSGQKCPMMFKSTRILPQDQGPTHEATFFIRIFMWGSLFIVSWVPDKDSRNS